MEIKEVEQALRVEGQHSNGKFSIEIGTVKDRTWTDNKFQMRFKDADSDCYMNMNVDELETVVSMIKRVIEIEKPSQTLMPDNVNNRAEFIEYILTIHGVTKQEVAELPDWSEVEK